ncbi:hypothetical protein R3X25_04390 [Lutibacter sp. TH_r2]|uniref:hypothetical protein n=1 Tax=Lutibacter sp. TH_r2 TaxID=3082083 RepID=UPI002952DE5E|nr:hypothetical protein [Lutibacter sp. TH_r2]MDV7186510.1 hypothetical protein [Lutibacter sp. TH_r2]
MKHTIIQLLLVCCLYTTSYAIPTTDENFNLNQTTADTFPMIRIGFDAPQIDHRQLLLAAHEATTDGLDWGYDAEMYEVLLDDMFWLIETKKCVIQGVPELYVDKEIPLGIIMSEQGEIQIQVDELENPIDSLVVYLKDIELDKLYNIQDSVYTTTLDQGEYSTRFAITFKSVDFVNEPTPVDEIDEPEEPTEITKKLKIQLFYNHKISSLVIRNKENIKINNALLFNRHGVKVNEWRRINDSSTRIKLPIQVRKGMYYIIIDTEIKPIKRKIVVHKS